MKSLMRNSLTLALPQCLEIFFQIKVCFPVCVHHVIGHWIGGSEGQTGLSCFRTPRVL
jgi:hypothetical protein